jgi:DNA excision repair protein ERCC-5
MQPNVDNSTESFKWGKPDLDALRLYAKQRFGWDQHRTDAILEPVLKEFTYQATEIKRQSTLDGFVSILDQGTSRSTKRVIQSKRLRRAMKKLKPSRGAPTEVDLSTSESESESEMEGQRSSAVAVSECATVMKPRIPRGRAEGAIPQRLKEESERKLNKERAIKVLKKK